MLHKAWNSKGEMPYCFPRLSIKFQGHTVQNITDFDPNWAFPNHRPDAAFKSLRFALLSFSPWIMNIACHMNHSMQNRYTVRCCYNIFSFLYYMPPARGTVWCSYEVVNFLENPHNRPIRVKYGVSFVDTNSDLCNASVTDVLFEISHYIGLCYNDTRLYSALCGFEVWSMFYVGRNTSMA